MGVDCRRILSVIVLYGAIIQRGSAVNENLVLDETAPMRFRGCSHLHFRRALIRNRIDPGVAGSLRLRRKLECNLGHSLGDVCQFRGTGFRRTFGYLDQPVFACRGDRGGISSCGGPNLIFAAILTPIFVSGFEALRKTGAQANPPPAT